jgi:hypothetical protein
MIISKKRIIILGISAIWLFALLNRIHVYHISEIVTAKSYKLSYSDDFVLVFKYKGITYQKLIESNISLEDNTYYHVLIKRNNPDDFIPLNFFGFVFNLIIISIFVTLVWLVFAQVFFEDIETFQLSKNENK